MNPAQQPDVLRLQVRLIEVKAEWRAVVRPAAPNPGRFRAVKQEADAIIRAGRWVSGPDGFGGSLGG